MADEKDGGKLRRTYERARESVTEGVDKITGREFRRQFEEFTDAVTTSVLGIYRDGAVAKDRIEQAEKRVAEIEGVVRFLSEANERLRGDISAVLAARGRNGTKVARLAILALLAATVALVLGLSGLLRIVP